MTAKEFRLQTNPLFRSTPRGSTDMRDIHAFAEAYAEQENKALRDIIEMCRDELIECGFQKSGSVMKAIKQALKK